MNVGNISVSISGTTRALNLQSLVYVYAEHLPVGLYTLLSKFSDYVIRLLPTNFIKTANIRQKNCTQSI